MREPDSNTLIQLDPSRRRTKAENPGASERDSSLNRILFLELSQTWRLIQDAIDVQAGVAGEPHDRLYLPIDFSEKEVELAYAASAELNTHGIDTSLLAKSTPEATAPFSITMDLNRALRMTPTPADLKAIQAYYGEVERSLDPGDSEGPEVLNFLDVVVDVRDLRKLVKRSIPVNKLKFSNHRLVREGGKNKVIPDFTMHATWEDGHEIQIRQGHLEPVRGSFGLTSDHPWFVSSHEQVPSPVALNSQRSSDFAHRAIQVLKKRFEALRKT